MKLESDKCRVVSISKARRLISDIGRVSQNRNIIRGLLEIDVTQPQQLIREHQEKSGEKISFTSYLTACAGRAVDSNKYVHAYLNWRGQLVLYEKVDIATMIEIEKDGKKFPIGHIVRAANQKTVHQIHEEVREIQAKPLEEKETNHLYAISKLPGFLRRFLLRLLDRSPRLIKRYKGTVVLTSVGMFGKGGGWGISLPTHTLGITVGGITEKPGVIEGRIEPREYLSVTLDFDHDIVNGVPAARFAQTFKELVENGCGLREF
ncbi:MAG: 2-oxo acid dehydrogenase subunit E2 [Anaerolineae bacterium]|nr:2-oxo acid dehydrogenase subunit E2 [Anaerolineae bacterium]